MTNTYLVRPLGVDQIAQAYPLVSIFDPELTKDQWLDYAGKLIAGAGSGDDEEVLALQQQRAQLPHVPHPDGGRRWWWRWRWRWRWMVGLYENQNRS